MYKAVIFDCDGTLVDCSKMIRLLYEGYNKMYSKKILEYEYFIPCYYMTEDETICHLGIPLKDKEIFYHICFGENDEKMGDVKLFDGILEVMKDLNKKGVRMGINTSRNYAAFLTLKKQLGDVYELLDENLIATSDRVLKTKPSPYSLFYIQKNAQCKMKEILFVGDSINDSLCAKYADCDFAVAKWGQVCKSEVEYKYNLESPYDLLKIIK